MNDMLKAYYLLYSAEDDIEKKRCLFQRMATLVEELPKYQEEEITDEKISYIVQLVKKTQEELLP